MRNKKNADRQAAAICLSAVVAVAAMIATAATPSNAASDTQLTIAPEKRCSDYERRHYSYSSSKMRNALVGKLGGYFAPYSLETHWSGSTVDVEHMVSLSEAHDSGACAWPRDKKRKFAQDIDNLTLAGQRVNRYVKVAKDVAEWLPDQNRCWFVNSVVRTKAKWGLSMDPAEAQAALNIMARCDGDFTMKRFAAPQPSAPTPTPDALSLYDDNEDGRITCREARAHGITPVRRAHPACEYMHDGNNDGIVCK